MHNQENRCESEFAGRMSSGQALEHRQTTPRPAEYCMAQVERHAGREDTSMPSVRSQTAADSLLKLVSRGPALDVRLSRVEAMAIPQDIVSEGQCTMESTQTQAANQLKICPRQPGREVPPTPSLLPGESPAQACREPSDRLPPKACSLCTLTQHVRRHQDEGGLAIFALLTAWTGPHRDMEKIQAAQGSCLRAPLA